MESSNRGLLIVGFTRRVISSGCQGMFDKSFLKNFPVFDLKY